ncbi:hypothetical protein GCM10027591_03240 [Zhihengliuella somnathii]
MSTGPLDEAYDLLRAYLHRPTDDTVQNREQLRSLLWIVAEAVERHGESGMALREIGDELTGQEMSPFVRRLVENYGAICRGDGR